MEHAPTIGALCGGRLAKAKGVRYGAPSGEAPIRDRVLETRERALSFGDERSPFGGCG